MLNIVQSSESVIERLIAISRPKQEIDVLLHVTSPIIERISRTPTGEDSLT